MQYVNVTYKNAIFRVVDSVLNRFWWFSIVINGFISCQGHFIIVLHPYDLFILYEYYFSFILLQTMCIRCMLYGIYDELLSCSLFIWNDIMFQFF